MHLSVKELKELKNTLKPKPKANYSWVVQLEYPHILTKRKDIEPGTFTDAFKSFETIEQAFNERHFLSNKYKQAFQALNEMNINYQDQGSTRT